MSLAAYTVNKAVDSKSKSKSEWFYLPQQLPLPLKYNALGINAHLRNSIENEFVNLGQLWFAEYLRPSQPKGVIASFSIQEKKTSISSSVSFDESRLFIRNSSTRNWTSFSLKVPIRQHIWWSGLSTEQNSFFLCRTSQRKSILRMPK